MPYWFDQARRPGRVQSATVTYRGRTYQFSATGANGIYNIQNFYRLTTTQRLQVSRDYRDYYNAGSGPRAVRRLALMAYYYRRQRGMTLFGFWYRI